MSIFLASNLNHYKKSGDTKIAKEIDNINGIVDQLKENLNNRNGITFVPADFADLDKIKAYSDLIFDALKLSGISFNNYYIIDINTQAKAAAMLKNSSMVIISGGDTIVQNNFFKNIKLTELLMDYDGVILGQSAGSINLADDVYNSPECEDDLSKPSHFKGLAKTNINIEPHFVFDSTDFNDDELLQRSEILKESLLRPIYAVCDTSHIFDNGSEQILYGEGYLISNSKITKLAKHGEKHIINQMYSKKI